MTPFEVGLICIGILLVAICIRIPVAFASLLTGVIGMLWLLPPQAAFRFAVTDLNTQFNSFPFSAMPMFILMGFFAASSGMTQKLFNVAYTWIGSIRGGLAVATVGACALFSAVCGSGPATAGTIGKVAYPQMKRFGYDDALSTGSIAAAGTLGPLIPPSGAMIIYAILTEQSIVKCLVSGILPGILVAILMGLTGFFICKRNPGLGPAGPKTTWQQKVRVLPGLIETVILFVFIIGGLYVGIFTPTQAGAAGAFGALIIGLIGRNLKWKTIWESAKESLRLSCMVLFLIAGSVVFGHFLTLSTVSTTVVHWAQQLPVAPVVIIIIICVFYVIGGCFIDSLGLLVLTIPITAPVVFSLGYDPIWYGVIMCMLGETGAITPPLGVNVFVIKGIAPEVSLNTIFRGILPFFITICVAIGIVIAFPIIATWIPSLTPTIR
jgi:C4-dicarboxylate transporter, DctM subunit